MKKLKKISLKKGLELLGYTNIKINNGYNYRSGFMEKDNQLYYFSTGDLRFYAQNDVSFVMHRKALDRQDFSGKGGPNQYGIIHELFEKGYELHIPFLKSDYNSL